jgi:hypothetical protein
VWGDRGSDQPGGHVGGTPLAPQKHVLCEVTGTGGEPGKACGQNPSFGDELA